MLYICIGARDSEKMFRQILKHIIFPIEIIITCSMHVKVIYFMFNLFSWMLYHLRDASMELDNVYIF